MRLSLDPSLLPSHLSQLLLKKTSQSWRSSTPLSPQCCTRTTPSPPSTTSLTSLLLWTVGSSSTPAGTPASPAWWTRLGLPWFSLSSQCKTQRTTWLKLRNLLKMWKLSFLQGNICSYRHTRWIFYFYSLMFNCLGGIHTAQGGLSDVVTQQEIIRRTVLFSQMIIFV